MLEFERPGGSLMRTAPPILYARTPRGDIAYQTVGDGPLDLVMVNGMGVSISVLWDYAPFAAVLERLTRFSRLILFDRRGSGISDPLPGSTPPTFEDWVEDIRAVMDSAGIFRAALMGERDAGRATALFAAGYTQRVQALVQCNTTARIRAAPDYPIGFSDERVAELTRTFEEFWGTERMQTLFLPSQAGNPQFLQ